MSSSEDVVSFANRVIGTAEENVFERAEIMNNEAEALLYRGRWRMIGLVGLAVVLLVGLAATPENSDINSGWIVGCCLVGVLGAMIGRYVYRKRSIW